MGDVIVEEPLQARWFSEWSISAGDGESIYFAAEPSYSEPTTLGPFCFGPGWHR